MDLINYVADGLAAADNASEMEQHCQTADCSKLVDNSTCEFQDFHLHIDYYLTVIVIGNNTMKRVCYYLKSSS